MKYITKSWSFISILILLIIFELVNTYLICQFPIYLRIGILMLIGWGYEIIIRRFLKH
ncbi:hypothetical protein SE1_00559 [Enterococcus hirae EnGen0127]|nr:hypothetical protein SE1_00559 [Enterococcus hirae EnGen0127]